MSLKKDKHTYESFFLMPTDANEISNILTSMKPKTSAGHDNISTTLLNALKSAICDPISIIINMSLQSGKVPANMKLAKVVPIYKAKEKSDLATSNANKQYISGISGYLQGLRYNRSYHF